MLLLQAFSIRSAYVFAVIAGTLLVGALGNEVTSGKGQVGFVWAYLVTMGVFVALAVEAVTTVGARAMALIIDAGYLCTTCWKVGHCCNHADDRMGKVR